MLSSLAPAVFAGVAGPVNSPAWVDCDNYYRYVQSTSKAYTGTSNILVSWVAPYSDSAGVGICQERLFSQMQFSVQVYHTGLASAKGPTFSSGSDYPPNGITVSVVKQTIICISHYCYTQNEPYILQKGDQICITELVWYGLYDDHAGGYCYYA